MKVKKFLLSSLTLLMLLVPFPSSYADFDEGINILYNNTEYSYIASYKASISDQEDGTVLVYAETYTISPVETLKLNIFLERLDGSRWVTKSHWSGYKYDNDTFSKYLTVPVDKSEKYRVRVVHTVTHDGLTESSQSITSSITIK